MRKKKILSVSKNLEKNKSEVVLPKKEFSFIRKFKDKIKDKFFPQKTLLINMELRNGMHQTFLICTAKPYFNFLKGTFVIDEEQKYYNINSKCFCLDYHQDLTIPVRRRININDLKKAVQGSDYEVENALNPLSIQAFLESKVAEGVMKGQQIDDFLKQIKLFLIITMIAAVSHLLIFVFKSGMLNSIKIPGIN